MHNAYINDVCQEEEIMATRTVEQLFSSLNESSAAVLEAVRAGNERTYRVSKAYLDEVEKGALSMLELGKRLADAPTDLAGFSALAFAKAGDAQRSLQVLVRQAFEEITAAGREARDTVQKIVEANREVGQAYASAIRGRTGDLLNATTASSTNNSTARPATPRRTASADA
jgi:hypothetical protein